MGSFVTFQPSQGGISNIYYNDRPTKVQPHTETDGDTRKHTEPQNTLLYRRPVCIVMFLINNLSLYHILHRPFIASTLLTENTIQCIIPRVPRAHSEGTPCGHTGTRGQHQWPRNFSTFATAQNVLLFSFSLCLQSKQRDKENNILLFSIVWHSLNVFDENLKHRR